MEKIKLYIPGPLTGRGLRLLLAGLTRLFHALLVAGTSLLWQADAMAASQVRTAAQESSAPKFIAKSDKVSIGGVCVDIFRAIEKMEPGIQFTGDQVWQPRARIEVQIKSGNLDLIC